MNRIITPLTLLAAAVSASASYYQLEASFDVKLTGSYSEMLEPVTKGTKTTSTVVVKTFRITNKDVLNLLVEAEQIDSASGWKIMAVGEDEEDSLVLRKSQEDDVYVGDIFSWSEDASAFSSKEVVDEETGTVSDTGKWTDTGSGEFNAGSFGLTYTGKQTGSYNYKFIKDSEQEFWVQGTKTTTVIGTGTYDLVQPDDGIVVEGTFTRGAQKTVKIMDE